MSAVGNWRNDTDEQLLVSEVSLDEPWSLVETYAGLVRESGTKQEKRAFAHLSKRLKKHGVPHTIHTPTLLISVPRRARLEILAPERRLVTAKTPSMSLSTGGRWKRGQVAYVPTHHMGHIRGLFEGVGREIPEIAGKVVLTEGYASPGKVADFTKGGAIGAIFISPGDRIHEGICTTIWGSPD
ncbi:MAG: peptidase M28, partial [bacterium]|nr:peptidase M28 [bacterium]